MLRCDPNGIYLGLAFQQGVTHHSFALPKANYGSSRTSSCSAAVFGAAAAHFSRGGSVPHARCTAGSNLVLAHALDQGTWLMRRVPPRVRAGILRGPDYIGRLDRPFSKQEVLRSTVGERPITWASDCKIPCPLDACDTLVPLS